MARRSPSGWWSPAATGTSGRRRHGRRTFGVPLAVIPAGTANDFARAMAIPLDEEAAAQLAATGDADAAAGARPMRRPPVRERRQRGARARGGAPRGPTEEGARPARLSAGASAAGLRERPIAVVARADGAEVHAGPAWQVTVACTGAFGGGAEIERADPGDVRLDLVVVPAGSRFGLVRLAVAMRRGTLPTVRAREVELESGAGDAAQRRRRGGPGGGARSPPRGRARSSSSWRRRAANARTERRRPAPAATPSRPRALDLVERLRRRARAGRRCPRPRRPRATPIETVVPSRSRAWACSCQATSCGRARGRRPP